MNPEVKEKWLTALRSGEYQQAENRLHIKGVGFCCLGVLCDLAMKEGVIPPPKTGLFAEAAEYVYDGEISILPGRVAEWAGLPNQNPEVRRMIDGHERFAFLTDLNDNVGAPFAEIADWIEEGNFIDERDM